MATAGALTPRPRGLRTSRRAGRSSQASTQNFLERLPSEILMEILSYLDASALFTLGHVNKRFYQLANENELWERFYTAEFGQKKKREPRCMDELQLRMASMEVQDRPGSYWKRLHFRTLLTCDLNKWRRRLGLISCHTGLPRETERVLRNLHVTWELTVSEKSGREGTHRLSWSHFSKTSVTVCWSGGGCLPDYQQISTLQLHGVRRLALNSPGLKHPGLRSLMARIDVQALTKSVQIIGQDHLVELKLLQPGVIFGVWKDQCSVAFILLTLHSHRLVEKSVQGSSVCPYTEPTFKHPFDDIDPEYGLHGYQLHVGLHDTVCEIMSRSFSQLFCRRAQVCDGLIPLSAISMTDLVKHTPLSGNFSLPWRCDALQGAVENCCIMSLTLLDEFRNPFWCVSSPVSLKPQEMPVCYDYNCENFLIQYQDPDGQVEMTLAWVEEQKRFFIISLVVYVAVSKVNKCFGRNY